MSKKPCQRIMWECVAYASVSNASHEANLICTCARTYQMLLCMSSKNVKRFKLQTVVHTVIPNRMEQAIELMLCTSQMCLGGLAVSLQRLSWLFEFIRHDFLPYFIYTRPSNICRRGEVVLKWGSSWAGWGKSHLGIFERVLP